MHNGERISNTGHETAAEPNPWEKMANEVPPFNPDRKVNNQTSEYDYDTLRQQKLAEQAQIHLAERQAELRKPVNIESLLSKSDEELAKWARRIDNSTFTIPDQENTTDKRLAEAIAGYKRASEFRDAEQEVLEDIQDYDRTYYSQDELIDRLRERKHDILQEKQNSGLENWLQQTQACNRLIQRLEKFYPETADQLDDNDMAYWEKITKSAQPIPAENLVPKTLPQTDLFQLIGSSSAVNRTKQQMASRYSAFKRRASNTETGSSDTASDDTEADELERQRTIADTREKVVSTYHQENEQPISYRFEASPASEEMTIVVGQEIPDSWFESKVTGNKLKSGFGTSIEQPPLIENYLQQALNVEFSKLSEDERQHHNYAELAQLIKEEVRKTRKMPDIAAIIKENEQEMTM